MKTKYFLIIFIMAAFLRFWGIWTAPLWYDESFSYLVARLPIDRMIAATAGDVHPPLYYLTIAPFALTGIPWLIRVPSVLFSLAALWLWWKILQDYRLPAAQETLGIVLMACIPFQVYYAQEARMYALLIFLVLATFRALSCRKWVLVGILSTLILYTHNYGMFYLPAFWLIMVINDWKFITALKRVHPERKITHRDFIDTKSITIALACAGLAYLPWVIILLRQMTEVQNGYWISEVTPGGLVYVLFSLFGPFTVPNWASLPVLISLMTLLAFVPLYIERPRWPVVIMAFVPLAEALVISFAWKPVLLFRGLAGSAPFLMWLAFIPLASLKARWQQALAAAFVVPFFLVGLYGVYAYSAGRKGIDDITRLERVIPAGETIYHLSDDTYLTMSANMHTHNIRVTPCGRDSGALSPLTRQALGMQFAEAEYVHGWVFVSLTPLSDACNFQVSNQLVTGSQPVIEFTANGVDYLSRELYRIDR